MKSRLGVGTSSKPAAEDVIVDRRGPMRYALDHGVSCPLGELVDLSIGGMRVMSLSKPLAQIGQRMMLTIESDGKTLNTVGEVVRLERKGLENFEIGIRFLNPGRDVVGALDSLAKFGFIGETMRACDSQTSPDAGGVASGWGGKTSGHVGSSIKPGPCVKITMRDPYKTLDVSRESDHDEIHQAYRELAKRYHPDVNPSVASVEKFRETTEAYRVLGNHELRGVYDRLVPCDAV